MTYTLHEWRVYSQVAQIDAGQLLWYLSQVDVDQTQCLDVLADLERRQCVAQIQVKKKPTKSQATVRTRTNIYQDERIENVHGRGDVGRVEEALVQRHLLHLALLARPRCSARELSTSQQQQQKSQSHVRNMNTPPFYYHTRNSRSTYSDTILLASYLTDLISVTYAMDALFAFVPVIASSVSSHCWLLNMIASRH